MTIHLCTGPTSPATRNVYLPIVATTPVNPVALFYDLLLHDSRQQRPRLEVCESLEAGAAQRAYGLAHGDPWAHKDSAGRGANGIARAYGCQLPAEYSDNANYIESLTAGMDDVQVAFDSLARSPSHKVHLFGENEFYKAQYHVGVGFAEGPDAPFRYYWCIWIAVCQH